MEAKTVWKEGLSFDGFSVRGNFALPLDSASDADSSEKFFSPMELILVGLAGCTGMDVISILQKKRQDVTGFEVRVQADRSDEHPKVFTHITLEYLVTGRNIDKAAVERAVELSETKYCSVGGMLNKALQIDNKITILETEVQ